MAHSLVFSILSTTSQPSSLYCSPKPRLRAHRRKIQFRRVMEPNGGGSSKAVVPKVTSSTNSSVPPGGPRLPTPNIPAWAKWALGSIICLAVPFYKKVLKIEDGVGKVAEKVVDTVKEVAGVAEKVAADISEALPDGSRLKKEVSDIERFVEKVEKDAEQAEKIIHKVLNL
ncbi:uncharacterized protein LOC109832048 isoform X2 [Asparagus officinalis]|uniref:uncharacterized protein LOC109832048 isoform X2 n=1 Tax=Asparagus officinalis TaxID=4686 RepID=UPI00098E45B1|nr:uncharacterized protein LOC109832048 isoform X2 [Asparagus officinalis]